MRLWPKPVPVLPDDEPRLGDYVVTLRITPGGGTEDHLERMARVLLHSLRGGRLRLVQRWEVRDGIVAYVADRPPHASTVEHEWLSEVDVRSYVPDTVLLTHAVMAPARGIPARGLSVAV